MDHDESALAESKLKAERFLGARPKLEGFDPQQKTAFYATVNKAGDAMQRLDIAGRIEDARPIARGLSSLASVDDLAERGLKAADYIAGLSSIDKSIADAQKNLTPELSRQNKENATKILGSDPDLSKLSADQRDGYYQRVVRADHLVKEGLGSPRQMAELANVQDDLKNFPAKLAAEPADKAWASVKNSDLAMVIVDDPNPEKLLDNKTRAEAALGFSPKLQGYDQTQKDAYYSTIVRANDAVKECIVQGRPRDGLVVAKTLQPLVNVDESKTPPDSAERLYHRVDNSIEDAKKGLDPKTVAANEQKAVKILGEQPNLQKLTPDQRAGFYARVVQMDRLTKEGNASPKAMQELNAQFENLKQLPAQLNTQSGNETWKSIEGVDSAMTPVNLPEKQPSRLSQAWQTFKDAGSRAVDVIKSIPDRIRARFSSEEPAAPPIQSQADEKSPVKQPPLRDKENQGLDNARSQQPDRVPNRPLPPLPAHAANGPQPQALNEDGKHQPPDRPLPPLPAHAANAPQPQALNEDGKHQPPDKPLPPLPNEQRIGVQFGADENHTLPKGPGLQASGVLESVEHKDGVATVHFKAGSHEQVLSVDEHSPGGKALGETLDQLHPGDQMSMKISQDQNKQEVVEVASKTQGLDVKVHEAGEVEKVTPTPQLQRNEISH
jgi:hypothetical protein